MLTMLFAFQSSLKLMRRHQLLLLETVNTVSRDTRSVAHRYATYLCSWDVKDDSLVGQLTTRSGQLLNPTQCVT